MPRLCSTSFGVEPSAGPEVEKYSTPLMLRWIARCTSDWTRSEIDAKSSVAAVVHVCSPSTNRRAHRKTCAFQLGHFRSVRCQYSAKAGAIRPGHPTPTIRTKRNGCANRLCTSGCRVEDDDIGYPVPYVHRRLKRPCHAEGMRDQHGLSSDAPRDIANHLREGVVNCRIVRFDRAVCSHGPIAKCFQPYRQWQKHKVAANQSRGENDNRLAITKAR